MLDKTGMQSAILVRHLFLHNWYRYVNTTIDFCDHINLITGETGTGKSVINDAVLYLTTGSTQFNKAAKNETKDETSAGKRTLKTYHRGYIGGDKKQYIRPSGEATSYLAAELYDSLMERSFVIMASIYSTAVTQEVKTTRYVFYNDKYDFTLTDLALVSDDNYTEYRASRATVNANGTVKPIGAFETASVELYREQLTRLFGDSFNINRFRALFEQNMSYRLNTRLSEFLRENLFPKREIQIESGAGTIDKITEIQAAIQRNDAKQRTLEPIKEQAIKYFSEMHLHKVSSNAKLYADLQFAKEDRERADEELAKLQRQEEIAEKTSSEAEEQNSRAILYLNQLKDRKHQADKTSGLSQLAADMAEARRAVAKGNAHSVKLNNYIIGLKQARGKDSGLDSIIKSFLSSIRTEGVDHYTGYMEIEKTVNELIEKCEAQREEYFCQMQEAQKNSSRCQALLEDLNSKMTTAGKDIIDFIKYIDVQKKIERRQVSYFIVADVVTSVDEEWRPCIESLLGQDRWALVCEPASYKFLKDTLDLYLRSGNRPKGVSIVCHEKIRNRCKTEKDSLAKKIRCENPYARAFLDFKLGQVIACSDKNRLESYRRAVTKNGIYWNGYSISPLPFDVMGYALGRDAIELRKSTLTDEKKKFAEAHQRAKQAYQKAIETKNRYADCLSANINEFINGYADTAKAERTLEDISEKYDKLQSELNIFELQKEIENAEGQQEEKRKQYEEALSRLHQLRDRMKALRETKEVEGSIAYLKDIETQAERAYDQLPPQDQMEAVQEYKNRCRKNPNPRTIMWDIHSTTAERIYNTVKEQLYNNYVARFPEDAKQFSITDKNSFLDAVIQRHENLRVTNSGELQAALQASNDKFRKLVGDTIIKKLYEHIQSAYRQRDLLRKELSGRRLNNRVQFDIRVEATTDPKLHKLYLNIRDAGKKLANQIDGPLADLLPRDDETAHLIQEMTDEILEIVRTKQDQQREAALDKILDYRNYLSFEVLKEEGDGNWIALTRKLSTDSGGEAQTAYYVILAASCRSLYSEHSLRLVMVDEAFDKIDNGRKSELAKFYRDFGLQCVFSTPHSDAFVEQAEMIISILKPEHHVYTFAISEPKKHMTYERTGMFRFRKVSHEVTECAGT